MALVLNTTPLFTALFGYIILRDTLGNIEKLCLIISFTGVLVLVIGKRDEPDTESHENVRSLIAMTMLIASPMFTAYGAITQRQMRFLSPYVSSFYISLFGLIVFTTVVLVK